MTSDPGKTICVEGFALRLPSALIEELEALSRGGLEVGGLLVGRELEDGSGVVLESIQPVSIEHRFGPSYQVSDADNETFRQTIARLRTGSEAQVMGHFRSHTKGPMEVMFTDLVIAELIGGTQSWAILISDSTTTPGVARVYRRTSERYVESPAFPLVLAEAQSQEIAATPVPYRTPSARRKFAAAALLAAAMALAAAAFWLRPPRPAAPMPVAIRLAVSRVREGVAVEWNPGISPAGNGTAGVLTIRGGGERLDIQLNGDQLRTGSLTYYAPPGAILEFELALYRDKTYLGGESVTYRGVWPTVPARRPQVRPADPDASPRTGTPEARPIDLPQVDLPQVDLPQAAPVASVPPPLPESPATIAQAPRVAEGPDWLRPGKPEPPASPPPVNYVAPLPVRKIMPTLPAAVRAMIQEPVSVELRVAVDAQGRVIGATPLNANSPGQRLVFASAVQAATQWLFEPARRDGRAVNSETTVRFDFARR